MNPDYLALPPARTRWRWLIFLVAVFLLEAALWQNLEQQKGLCQTTGIRFASAIPSEALEQAEAFSSSEKNTQGIYASFWGQCRISVSAPNNRKADAVTGIGYCGNAEDCLPVPYCQGGAPGVAGKGCALSEGLAQSLFGSTDIVGEKVSAQKQVYTITGVFTAEDEVLLFPSREQLTCGELRGVSWDTPKAEVETWCSAAGLGAPQCIVYGPQKIWILSLLCGLPLVAVGIIMCGSALRWSCSWPKGIRALTWVALAVLAALLFPGALEALPGWLIPGRWSNFDFWRDLAERIHEQQRALALCTRYWPDLLRRL